MRRKGKVYNGIIFKSRKSRGVPPLNLLRDSAHQRPAVSASAWAASCGASSQIAIRGFSRNLGGRAAWGRVCGRAKLGAGTLRCLHLCWRLPWDWSDAEQLGRCPKPHKGRCPLTLQGADEKGRSPPLTPFRDWVGRAFMLLPRAAFWGLRLCPCLLPQLSVKNPIRTAGCTLFAPLYTKSRQKECALL